MGALENIESSRRSAEVSKADWFYCTIGLGFPKSPSKTVPKSSKFKSHGKWCFGWTLMSWHQVSFKEGPWMP